ncbi:hypothetical protein BVRB_8g189360 [Beta vulgaris subsp. vulgaris]|nr:hypothetical protein BVRB_8g189360 [Beta vulgaris subsp. vulgaris]
MNQNQTNEEILEQQEIEKLIQSLPKVTLRNNEYQMIEYENFYYYNETDIPTLRNTITFQKHFVARDDDIYIISPPKTGSSWLKSLLFSIVHRKNHPTINQIPLHTHHTHELVYSLDFLPPTSFTHLLNNLSSPRLLNTSIPYTSLPNSVSVSGSRIIYLCRSPYDTLMSFYNFFIEYAKKSKGEGFILPTLEDCYQDFSEGKFVPGPFFEHVTQYWDASVEKAEKVLFVLYEDMKIYPIRELKRVAEFVGMQFSDEEESEGVIQQIIDLCSVNDNKGLEVREWLKSDEFTADMSERMVNLMVEKFGPTELFFKMIP